MIRLAPTCRASSITTRVPRGCSWPSQPQVRSRGEKITPVRQPKSIPSRQGGSMKVEPSPFL